MFNLNLEIRALQLAQDVLVKRDARCPGEPHLSLSFSFSLFAHIVNLDSGSWITLDGDGGGLIDHGSLSSAASSSSSSFQTTANKELSLLMPCGSVSWWPRHDWDAWLQRNVIETTKEFDAKLDVTPETNDTSASEVASTLKTFV